MKPCICFERLFTTELSIRWYLWNRFLMWCLMPFALSLVMMIELRLRLNDNPCSYVFFVDNWRWLEWFLWWKRCVVEAQGLGGFMGWVSRTKSLQLHANVLQIKLIGDTLPHCTASCAESIEIESGKDGTTTGLFALRDEGAEKPSYPAPIERIDGSSSSPDRLVHNFSVAKLFSNPKWRHNRWIMTPSRFNIRRYPF